MEMGIYVIFEVEESLKSIIEISYPELEIVIKGEEIPEFDYHCPLMSLPLAFKTTQETIPSIVKYLELDEKKISIWKDRIKTKKNIGICWRGNTLQVNYDNRSIPVKLIMRFLSNNYNIYSLQKDISIDEKNELINNKILGFENELIDFSETAAFCSQMDLIITIDTSVAHLACSIGMKVWILLPYIPDFRWFWDIGNSPWYPNAKIFRQSKPGDWDSVITDVVLELKRIYPT